MLVEDDHHQNCVRVAVLTRTSLIVKTAVSAAVVATAAVAVTVVAVAVVAVPAGTVEGDVTLECSLIRLARRG